MKSKKVFAIIFHGKERYKINIEKAYSNVIRNCGFFCRLSQNETVILNYRKKMVKKMD